MAEPTPTDGVAPLTAAEQKQLEALQAKQAAAAAAEAESKRQTRIGELTATGEFLKLVRADKVLKALDDAIASKPDVDTLQRLLRIKSMFDVDLTELNNTVTTANTPLATAMP